MTDLYESTTGDFPKQPFDPLIYFIARPVVGGHFFHLTLQKADKANGISASNPYKYGPKSNDVIGGGANVTAAETGGDADLALDGDALFQKESSKPKPHAALQEEKLQYWEEHKNDSPQAQKQRAQDHQKSRGKQQAFSVPRVRALCESNNEGGAQSADCLQALKAFAFKRSSSKHDADEEK